MAPIRCLTAHTEVSKLVYMSSLDLRHYDFTLFSMEEDMLDKTMPLIYLQLLLSAKVGE